MSGTATLAQVFPASTPVDAYEPQVATRDLEPEYGEYDAEAFDEMNIQSVW